MACHNRMGTEQEGSYQTGYRFPARHVQGGKGQLGAMQGACMKQPCLSGNACSNMLAVWSQNFQCSHGPHPSTSRGGNSSAGKVGGQPERTDVVVDELDLGEREGVVYAHEDRWLHQDVDQVHDLVPGKERHCAQACAQTGSTASNQVTLGCNPLSACCDNVGPAKPLNAFDRLRKTLQAHH